MSENALSCDVAMKDLDADGFKEMLKDYREAPTHHLR